MSLYYEGKITKFKKGDIIKVNTRDQTISFSRKGTLLTFSNRNGRGMPDDDKFLLPGINPDNAFSIAMLIVRVSRDMLSIEQINENLFQIV